MTDAGRYHRVTTITINMSFKYINIYLFFQTYMDASLYSTIIHGAVLVIVSDVHLFFAIANNL